ncbi:MAG: hypothetical protein OEX02_09435 [Cyclobacteriaceae bacterium]|nr:hypothetical protein [Cyclobacteriaceae bacterium]
MKIFRSLYLIINYKTFIVTILASASTWLCDYYDIKADFPLTLIGIAIVFPVVFSIDSAFKRRERTLALLGDFKAHLVSIFLATRDWIPKKKQFQADMEQKLLGVFDALRNYCTAEDDQLKYADKLLFKSISELSLHIQEFRKFDMYLGEVSRVNQYMSKMTIDIENIKAIRLYPTPITLRAYSRIFIYSFPILYGPYFQYMSESISEGLQYMMPIVFTFILISLDNIQTHLENPFDQVGEDDVKFDVEVMEEMLNESKTGTA